MEASSQAVDPDGFYSTTSGTYEEAQPVVARNVPSAHRVRTETSAASEDVYSRPSGVYEEAQLVKPSNVPTSKTVTLRAETAATPEDVYSTPSGVYEEANPVQAGNVLTGQTITLTETRTAQDNVYSTPSGIYEEGEPVQQINVLSGGTVKTETAAAATPEDVYSTPSGTYEEPEVIVMRDVAPGQGGREGTFVTGQNRGKEQAADRTGSSADRSEEEPARHDRIRPFLSRRKGVCLVVTSCVAVAAMLFGTFIGQTSETSYHDRPYPVTLQGNIQASLSTQVSTSDKTRGVVPTTAAYKVIYTSSTADETTTEEGSRQSVTFGGRGSGPGQFALPTGVVVSSTNEIFVADHDNRRVQVYSMEGNYLRHFQTIVPRTAGKMLLPEDIAIDGNDNLWVVGTVVVVGALVVQYSRYGRGLSMFDIQRDRYFGGIAVDLRNGQVIVTRPVSGKVQIFQPDGSLIGVFGQKWSVSEYVSVNTDGNILMLSNGFVHVYNETGQFLFRFAGPGGCHLNAMGICTDSSGHVLVADRQYKRVSMLTSSGQFVRQLATGLKMVKYFVVGTKGQLVVIDVGDNTVTVYPSY